MHIPYTYKTENVCLCVYVMSVCSLFLTHGHSFERICMKFGVWHPYTLRMVRGASIGR